VRTPLSLPARWANPASGRDPADRDGSRRGTLPNAIRCNRAAPSTTPLGRASTVQGRPSGTVDSRAPGRFHPSLTIELHALGEFVGLGPFERDDQALNRVGVEVMTLARIVVTLTGRSLAREEPPAATASDAAADVNVSRDKRGRRMPFQRRSVF
jgi:hypothetical protein